MSWKDDYRENKKSSGLTWDEYHNKKFVHVDDQNELRTDIEELSQTIEAMTTEYKQLKRELHEVRVLMESDEFDP